LLRHRHVGARWEYRNKSFSGRFKEEPESRLLLVGLTLSENCHMSPVDAHQHIAQGTECPTCTVASWNQVAFMLDLKYGAGFCETCVELKVFISLK
jgi:hypothetical protein